MAILDRLFGPKSLSCMDVIGLRKAKILLQRQRGKLLQRIEDVATAKQKGFALVVRGFARAYPRVECVADLSGT